MELFTDWSKSIGLPAPVHLDTIWNGLGGGGEEGSGGINCMQCPSINHLLH